MTGLPPPCTAPGNDYREVAERQPRGTPHLGVVIPVYNRGDLLARTLAGLLAQTLPDDRFTVAVADDGSTEDIASLVAEFSDRLRITHVRQERNGFGAGRARNLGAATVAGDVILFLDSDCIPSAQLLERHAWWHARASNLVVAGTRRAIDSSPFSPDLIARGAAALDEAAGGPDERGEFPPDDWRRVFYRRTRRLLLGDAGFRSGTSANLSVRRDRLAAVGGFAEEFRQWGGEDTELVWRLWNSGAYVVPDLKAVVFHQTHDDPEDAQHARAAARRSTLPLVADRVPHAFYRKAPTPFASVPMVSWIAQVASAEEADRLWREASASRLADAEIVLCGPAPAVAHLQAVAEANDSVHVVATEAPTLEPAVRAARGAYLALIDGRARIARGLIAKAIGRLEKDSRAGAVRVAYRFQGGDRYVRLDDLLAVDESVGRFGLPLFAVVRRRELMKDERLLDQPHAAWAAALERMARVELVITDTVTIDATPITRSPGRRSLDLAGAELREAARGAVSRTRRQRAAAAPPPEAARDDRIAIEYVGLTGKDNMGDEAVRIAIERLLPWASVGTGHADPKLLMVGGGTLVNGRRYYLTRMLRQDSPAVERALFGTGVRSPEYWGQTEPMEDWFSFIDSALIAGVRGPDSVTNLRELGYRRDLPILGDPALSLDAPAGAARTPGRVVVCPVYTSGNLHGGDDTAVFAAMARTIARLRADGREVVMLSAFPEDDRWIIQLMRDAGAPEMPYVSGYADIDECLALLASADLVIGERLHAAILAAAVGTPFVALQYRPKVLDFTRSIGQEAATVRTDQLHRLDPVVDAVLADRDGAAAALQEPVARFRRRQRAAAEELRTALGG